MKDMMFTAEQSWKMSETEKVVAIIRDVECWRLGNWDGCCCSDFTIRNVEVDISCGKGGEKAVKVSSRSGDYAEKENLRPILAEVLRQVSEQSSRAGAFAGYLNGEPAVGIGCVRVIEHI